MSDRWTQRSKSILDEIEKLEKTAGKDRLELVRSMRFVLGALNRSLRGWTRWINNPDIMIRFKQEDLEEMNKKLSGFVRSFMEYDLEITKREEERGIKIRRRAERRRRGGEDTFYI